MVMTANAWAQNSVTPEHCTSDPNSWCFQMPLGNYALRTTWKQECGLMFLDENEEAITGNVNAYVGIPFTAPLFVNPNDLSVTYSSSNTDVATVDENGVVTILATGTTTITAAFAGNDDIQPCEASYTLVVSEPYTLTLNTNDPAMGTVTLTDVAEAYEAFKTNTTTYYASNGITVEGSAVNNNGLKVSTENSITISSPQKTITKVDLHAGGGWGFVANLTTTKGTVDWSSNYQSGSITGVNAKSLMIGMQQQSMYIDSITVYYMPDSVAPYMNGTTVVADKYRIVPGKNVTVKATAASATHYIAEWTKQEGTDAAVTLGTDIAETASTTFPMEASTVIAGTFAVRSVLKLATNDAAMGTVKIDSAGGSGEKTIIPGISVIACCESMNGEGCDKLFDGDTSGHNKWGTEDQNKYVEFQTSAAVQVNGYTLVTGDDNADYWGQGRNPKSWVLKAKLASTDSWTTVATVNNDETMQDVNYTPFDFEMDFPGTYQYFRFEVSALRGSGNFMQLGEMQLFNRAISFLDSVSVKNAAANEYYVLPGAKVAVKAIPAAGYQLLKWEDNSTDLDRTVTVTGDTIVLATFGLPTPGVTPEGNLTVFGGRFLSETGEIVATPALTETGGLIDESAVPVPVPVFTCPATVKDTNDNVYEVVKLGNQCWMKSNLRTMNYPDGSNISASNMANPNNTTANGLLYSWSAVMHGASSSSANPSGVQGICPRGWHVPSDAEWTQMTDYVSSQSDYQCGATSNKISKALASKTIWKTSTEFSCTPGNSPQDNDATGFSAIPDGGVGPVTIAFGEYAVFWSSTEKDNSSAYFRSLFYNSSTVTAMYRDKNYKFSVRCVRDEE